MTCQQKQISILIILLTCSWLVTCAAQDTSSTLVGPNVLFLSSKDEVEALAAKAWEKLTIDDKANGPALDQFIATYPDTQQAYIAYSLRYAVLQKRKNTSEYYSFLNRYPNRLGRFQALTELLNLLLSSSEKKSTKATNLLAFSRRYPGTQQGMIALDKAQLIQVSLLETLVHNDTPKPGAYEACIQFLTDHPTSPYCGLVNELAKKAHTSRIIYKIKSAITANDENLGKLKEEIVTYQESLHKSLSDRFRTICQKYDLTPGTLQDQLGNQLGNSVKKVPMEEVYKLTLITWQLDHIQQGMLNNNTISDYLRGTPNYQALRDSIDSAAWSILTLKMLGYLSRQQEYIQKTIKDEFFVTRVIMQTQYESLYEQIHRLRTDMTEAFNVIKNRLDDVASRIDDVKRDIKGLRDLCISEFAQVKDKLSEIESKVDQIGSVVVENYITQSNELQKTLFPDDLARARAREQGDFRFVGGYIPVPSDNQGIWSPTIERLVTDAGASDIIVQSVPDLDGDAKPDVYYIDRSGRRTGKTDLHLSFSRLGYAKLNSHYRTELPPTNAEWVFKFCDANHDHYLDLVAVHCDPRTSKTFVSILDGKSGFKSFIYNGIELNCYYPPAGLCIDLIDFDKDPQTKPELLLANIIGDPSTDIDIKVFSLESPGEPLFAGSLAYKKCLTRNMNVSMIYRKEVRSTDSPDVLIFSGNDPTAANDPQALANSGLTLTLIARNNTGYNNVVASYKLDGSPAAKEATIREFKCSKEYADYVNTVDRVQLQAWKDTVWTVTKNAPILVGPQTLIGAGITLGEHVCNIMSLRSEIENAKGKYDMCMIKDGLYTEKSNDPIMDRFRDVAFKDYCSRNPDDKVCVAAKAADDKSVTPDKGSNDGGDNGGGGDDE